ncbi:MAG: hypothetical protein KGL39_25760 [Patescibacteria group bacterium]|nr:hypothetical protein [Patescibacteria group bacterium]
MEHGMEGGAGTIEAPETAPEGVASGAEDGASAAAGGEKGAATRTFTDADVQRIVQDRLKAWQKYGKPEELEARLTRAQQIEQWAEKMRGEFTGRRDLPGGQAGVTQAPLSEEDKKVQAYLERVFPGIGKYQERMTQFEAQAQELHQFRWQSISETNRKSLADMAAKAGYTPEQVLQSDPNVPCIEKYVADSIRGNRADYEAYMKTGDSRIVAKHFEAVDKWIKGFAPKPPAATPPNAAAAKDGKKIASLPPRMPANGVTAPTSQKRKLTDSERVSQAFDAFSKS